MTVRTLARTSFNLDGLVLHCEQLSDHRVRSVCVLYADTSSRYIRDDGTANQLFTVPLEEPQRVKWSECRQALVDSDDIGWARTSFPVKFAKAGVMMRTREYQAAARKAQKLADSEADPNMKAEHVARAEQWTELALTADVFAKLQKAISAKKKGM